MGDAVDVEDVFRLVGTTLDTRFVVTHVVAEGGFGIVYHAHQAALERPVAVKVLKTPVELGGAAREQFLGAFAAEAKTIARITHPNIVQVYDFGVSTMPSGERAGWMALEWLKGPTLEEDLAGRRGAGGRAPAECLKLLGPILSALATVHAAGVAHRDLKPANIMLLATPGGAVPKLLDFGIAKIMETDEEAGTGHTATRSRQIAFSPAYASAEQVSHGRSGPWTDVHALALILIEMLTDRAPYSADDTTGLFRQILDPTRPSPARSGVEVGPWEAVLARAVASVPGDRYKDAAELLLALESTVDEASLAYAAAPPSRRAVSALDGSRAPDTTVAVVPQLEAAARTLRPIARADVAGDGAPPSARRWTVHAILASGAVVLASVAAFVVVTSHTTATVPSSGIEAPAILTSAPTTARGSDVVRPPATGSPEPVPAAEPSASASSGVPHVEVRPRAPLPPLARAHAAPSAPSAAAPEITPTKPRVNCDPPFTVDEAGRKHYKPECDN